MPSVTVATIGPVTAPAVQGAGNAVREISGLPEGFPKTMDSKLAWVGADIKAGEYIYYLTEGDVAELEAAYEHFMRM